MNNELPKEWHSLVVYAKSGRIEFSDAAIIAADELIKEQQAHIERLRDKAEVAASELAYLIDKHNIHNMEDNSYLYDHQTPHELMSVLNETPAQSLDAVKREWQADEFDNNLLPKLGSEVFFHLASSDSWEPFNVTGFSVLNSLTSTDYRVFIHGVDSDGFKNVRLIQDIKEHNNG